MNPLKNKHWFGNRRESELKEDRRKPLKGLLGEAVKHGVRLRGWRAIESATQMSYVPNGTKECTTKNNYKTKLIK
jgi:hypothetical protein